MTSTTSLSRKRKNPIIIGSSSDTFNVPSRYSMPNFSFPKQCTAKIVVAIDFGTVYSGFGYALSSDAEKVYCFYEWPDQHVAEAKPYCKTRTSLLYFPTGTDSYELRDWGWTAIKNHRAALQRLSREPQGKFVSSAAQLRSCGYLASKFKLQLAPTSSLGVQMFTVSPLPPGLTAKRLISDYLKCLSEFIITVLQRSYGDYISKKEIQWCLTVPALWDDTAKQQMVECAEVAGLVRGSSCHDPFASPHSLIIVLEPEAASVYCQSKLKEVNFTKGSRFLVVDVGGGTVDLVVHEKVDDSGVKVKEIACSTGDLCGGTYVDAAFIQFLSEKICCLSAFSAVNPGSVLGLQDYIEKAKCSFNGDSESFVEFIEIPARLARAWEAYDSKMSWWREKGAYDMLTITREDIISIFNGVVQKILRLIEEQLNANPTMEAILVVGGFSSSPYLMRKIQETFSSKVSRILNPVNPGTAVCHGAVAFGAIDAEVMLSRKSRKTYVVAYSRTFRNGDPPEKKFVTRDGRVFCRGAVRIYVKRGDSVLVNHSIKHVYTPIMRSYTSVLISVYATDNTDPKFVTDSGMELVKSWDYPISAEAQNMKAWPEFEGEMFFGRTKIEMAVTPTNYTGASTLTSMEFQRVFV